ncbi:MAG: hypothetical protein ACI4XF_11310 [Oscillospiraceae bacterium]
MNIEIDKLTPCLENVKSGEIVDTAFSVVSVQELKALHGWKFRWSSAELHGCDIYKLTVNGDERIQGLVAVKDVPRDKAVYVKIAESAPHNMGKEKEYAGVGGHLFAIAVLRSFELGYDGFIYMDAKNLRLVSHYAKTLGAIFIGNPHPFRMAVDEEAAKRLIEFYNFRRDKNV